MTLAQKAAASTLALAPAVVFGADLMPTWAYLAVVCAAAWPLVRLLVRSLA